MRYEFSKSVIDTVRVRAGYICSNPECRSMTIAGAEYSNEKTVCLGVVSHIIAASPKGPRGDKNVEKELITSVENAIYLCSNCSYLIDKNQGKDFSQNVLRKWKDEHENWIRNSLNKKWNDRNDNNTYIRASSKGQVNSITANEINFINTKKDNLDPIDVDRLFFERINLVIDRDFILNYNEGMKNGKLLKTHLAILDTFINNFNNPEDEFIDEEINKKYSDFIREVGWRIPKVTPHNLLRLIDCETYFNVSFREKLQSEEKRKGFSLVLHEILYFMGLKFDASRDAVPLPSTFKISYNSYCINIEEYDSFRKIVKKKIFI